MSAIVCCRCERLTLRYVERASGPGWTLYACPNCARLLAAGPLPGCYWLHVTQPPAVQHDARLGGTLTHHTEQPPPVTYRIRSFTPR